ncbi:MAG: hypothetical protein IJ147_01685 [Lachnospiraceae bacterium]|nr:hypothetical protein [Lachnospiraceae bacterium]
MKTFCRSAGAVILLFVILTIVFTWREWLIAFDKPINLNSDHPADYTKVRAVEADINILYGRFAREEKATKNNKGQITHQSCDYYYVVPVFGETDIYYVGVVVDSQKAAPYDQVSELTGQYLTGELEQPSEEGIAFQGGFLKMEDEMYERFQKWFRDREYFADEEDLKEHVLPLVLEQVNYKPARKSFIVTIVFSILCIVMLVYGFRSEHAGMADAANEMITINGTSYPSDNFADINALVRKGKTDKAVRELQRLTNVSEAEAAAIIQRWNSHWGS